MDTINAGQPGALGPDTILKGRYLIRAAVKITPYNIQYRATDLVEKADAVIVEYFENAIMRRQPDGHSIACLNTARAVFETNRESFFSTGQRMLQQGAVTARPGELAVTDVFRENHTVYLVQKPGPALERPAAPMRASEGQTGSAGQIRPDRSGLAQQEPKQKPHKKRRWPLGIGIAAAACAVLAAGLLTFHMLPNHSSNKGDSAGSGGGTHSEAPASPGPEATSKPVETDPPVQERKTHTLMFYICGSNLESGGTGTASAIIDEILKQRIDTDYDNVILYTGGTQDWVDPRIPDGGCAIWKSSGRGSLIQLDSPEAPENMGEAQTLASFVNYCDTHYPAEHNALILWDHGGGSVVGFGMDELFHEDSLTLEELSQALSATSYGETRKLDWIGFDTCLMATLETADAVDEYARYLLASEELEPAAGWSYAFLERLQDDPEPRELCSQVIRDYFDRITALEDQDSIAQVHSMLTLSCLDLAYVDPVKNAVDSFAGAAWQDWKDGKKAEVLAPRAKVKQIALLDSGGRNNAMDLVDLGDLADCYEADYPEQAESIRRALSDLVCEEQSNVERMCGVSLYYPCDSWTLYRDAGGKEALSVISPSADYASFVREETDWRIDAVSDASWLLESSWTEDGGVKVHLSQEQQADCYLAYAGIFMVTPQGYVPVMKQVVLYPDANGDLVLAPTQRAVCLRTSLDGPEEEISYMIPVTQVEDTGIRAYYTTDSLTLQDEGGYLETGMEQVDVSAGFSGLSSGNQDEMTLHGVYIQETQSEPWWFPQTARNTVVLDYWEQMSYTLKAYVPTMKGDGTVAEYESWEDAGDYQVGMVDLNQVEEMEIVRIDLRDAGETFACQIVVEDIYGVLHGSEILQIAG